LKNKIAIEKGFDVLVVWEDDYKNNPKKVLKECLEFLEK
jgi:very-short-patch-repair endonuclease